MPPQQDDNMDFNPD